MCHVAWLGISPDELNDYVFGAVWKRWCAAEPDLLPYAGLDDLHALRGLANDPPLGALVRLAAVDGGDDVLAATALAHQLERGARHLMNSLHDLCGDIDELVMATLWIQIRCFPWRRRRRAYAANLLRDTRSAVLLALAQLEPCSGRGPTMSVDPYSPVIDLLPSPESVCVANSGSATEDTVELMELLDWALATSVISTSDAALLLDLVEAGHVEAGQDTPWTRRGICTQAAARHVADRRGVCVKTVTRERDRIVEVLRGSAVRYFDAVA